MNPFDSGIAARARRVLIVDDEQAILRVFRKALTSRGYLTETVSGGDAALRMMRTSDFDVVVSDINMAKGNGLDLLRDLRALGHEAPVILMTGRPSSEVAKQATALGAYRYLAKPVTPSMLCEIIEGAALSYDRVRELSAPAPTPRAAAGASSGSLRDMFERGDLTRR